MVKLEYTPRAQRDLLSLEVSVARRIIKKIEENASLADPLLRAKSLTGTLSHCYRYRIGDYRAVFSVEENGSLTLLTIFMVGHRREVYK
jgi:mRNA interferase RelE/StbE